MTESELRAVVPVYVGSFNQPSYLEQMVDTLLRNGFSRITVADNASTSVKLLKLLAQYDERSGVSVWRQERNVGPTATVQEVKRRERGPFIFTDPDLELSRDLPADFLTTLFRISRAYRCRKVGLALELPAPDLSRDLVFVAPDGRRFTVQDWEARFWRTALEPQVYRADVDTTFFLWNPEVRMDFRRAYARWKKVSRIGRYSRFLPSLDATDIRVAREGFVARHLPWYKDDRFPEDERAYYKETATRASTWLRDSD